VNGAPYRGGLSAESLKQTFDAAFAAPPAVDRQAAESFLALAIDAHAYAIRVREVTGLVVARKIVPIGSPIRGMLGLAGIRGDLVPVYSLPALLGYAQEDAAPRWFVLCRAAVQVALAFANFDGYVETSGLAADGREALIRDANGVRELIRVPPLLDVMASLANDAVASDLSKAKEP
jgi:hypothetical protein